MTMTRRRMTMIMTRRGKRRMVVMTTRRMRRMGVIMTRRRITIMVVTPTMRMRMMTTLVHLWPHFFEITITAFQHLTCIEVL